MNKKHSLAALEALTICKRLYPWRCSPSLPLRRSLSAFTATPERFPTRSSSRGFWPSQALALRPCIAQTGPDSLLDQRALEFRHRTNDLKHEPTGGRGQVEIVFQADELHPERLKLSERSHQMLERAREPI